MDKIKNDIDVKMIDEFIEFLAISGYSIDIAICGDMYSLTILDNYEEDLFFYTTSSSVGLTPLINSAIMDYINTLDGEEMLLIWKSQ